MLPSRVGHGSHASNPALYCIHALPVDSGGGRAEEGRLLLPSSLQLPLVCRLHDVCDLKSPILTHVSRCFPSRNQSPLTVDGIKRSYRVHVPVGYDPNEAAPLVLSFHGWGGTAAGDERYLGLSTTADAHGFFAVYPQG